jgi:hypothetical protein
VAVCVRHVCLCACVHVRLCACLSPLARQEDPAVVRKVSPQVQRQQKIERFKAVSQMKKRVKDLEWYGGAAAVAALVSRRRCRFVVHGSCDRGAAPSVSRTTSVESWASSLSSAAYRRPWTTC